MPLAAMSAASSNYLGSVQQGLGGYAAVIQAHAAQYRQRSISVTFSPRSAARKAAV